MVFDHPFTSNGTFTGGDSLTFNTTSNAVVQAKVGLSYVSIANAAANRTAENPNWNFTTTQTAAHTAWNNVLGKIAITGGTTAQQTVFYTSLYHALLHPNVVSDTNGQYRGFDNQMHTVTAGHTAQYGNFSGWDIYRAQAQLEALVAPTQASDTAQSMVNDYAQGGMFPKWAPNNGETYVMVGDPSDSIIADYYAFGARNFDTADRQGRHGARGDRHQQHPARPQLPGQQRLPAVRRHATAAATTTATSPRRWSTTPPTSPSPRSPARSATPRPRASSPTARRTGRTCSTPTSGFMQPKLVSGAWKGGFSATSGDRLRRGHVRQYTGMVPFNVGGLADGQGRQRGHAVLPEQRAGELPRRRRRRRRPRQRAVGRAALGVRLRRPAVQDAAGRPAGAGPAVAELARPTGASATTTSAP